MSAYLYFLNKLKDVKDQIQADMTSCKIFLPLIVTVFKEKLDLQLLLIFYSSIRFVLEITFISEQIAKNRFGALLEISDKFITKFNSNSLENLLYDFKNSGQVVLLESSQFAQQKLGLNFQEWEKI